MRPFCEQGWFLSTGVSLTLCFIIIERKESYDPNKEQQNVAHRYEQDFGDSA